MSPTILLQITPEKINVGLQDGQTLGYDNRVAYDPARLTMLSFGENEARLKSEMGTDWPAFRQKAAFTRIFDPQAKGPIFDFHVLEILLLRMRQQAFPKRFIGRVSWPWNGMDMQAEIQDYEQLSLGRRREFEYYLQDFQQVNHLSVNGKDCTIPMARRYLQAGVGTFLRTLLPALVLYGGLVASIDYWREELALALGITAIGAAGALAVYLLGTAIYLYMFRGRLPHGYLRYQLRGRISWLRKLTRWLSDRLLD